MNFNTILLLITFFIINVNTFTKNAVIEDIGDTKQFKKLLRTKNNVLVLYVSSIKETQNTVKVFREAADIIKGQGTMVIVDCSNNEKKKLCKNMKASPTPAILKHYKDGNFHKNYDRQVVVSSIVNFMRDPTGDLPWEEDPSGIDVLHVQDAKILERFLKKETKPIMVMFYAPWCGFCQQMKPDYAAAATELKPKYIMAAIDANRPENSIIKKQYNITGFPTLLYYENGQMKHLYEGENKKDGLVAFMKNPQAAPLVKPKELDWASETTSEIVHLTSNSFEPALKDEASVLVMFYAPWCGHCKRMKPEYEKAAQIMKEQKISGVLAALDATKESSIANQFQVKGYPTVKYFVNGEFKFDVNVRESDKIIEFMKNPSEPPPPPPPEKNWEDEDGDVVHLNTDTFKPFLKKKKHVLVMFYAPWCGHCKNAKPEFNTAANHFKDDPKVELAAVDCMQHKTLCSVYSIKGFPTIKYFSFLKISQEYEGGRTANDFIKFLKSPLKIEEKPFGNYPGAQHVLVLDEQNFEESLRNNRKLLIMFYSPMCGHCKQFKPIFSKAAERIALENIGTLAAVNAKIHIDLANKFKILSYPSLKYFENGSYKKDYNGPRTIDDIYNFIKSPSNKKFKDEL